MSVRTCTCVAQQSNSTKSLSHVNRFVFLLLVSAVQPCSFKSSSGCLQSRAHTRPRPLELLPALPALPVPRVFKELDDGLLFGLA